MRPRRLRLDIEEREGRRWSSDGDEGRGQVGSLAAAAVVGRISMVERERERKREFSRPWSKVGPRRRGVGGEFGRLIGLGFSPIPAF